MFINLFDGLAAGPFPPDCRIFAKDATGHYFYMNEQFARDAGKPREFLLGARDEATAWAHLAADCRAEDQRVMQHNRDTFHLKILPTTTRRRKIMIRKTAIYDALGKVIGVAGIYYPEPRSPEPKGCRACKKTQRALDLALSLLSAVQMASYEEQIEAIAADAGEAQQLDFL